MSLANGLDSLFSACDADCISAVAPVLPPTAGLEETSDVCPEGSLLSVSEDRGGVRMKDVITDVTATKSLNDGSTEDGVIRPSKIFVVDCDTDSGDTTSAVLAILGRPSLTTVADGLNWAGEGSGS